MRQSLGSENRHTCSLDSINFSFWNLPSASVTVSRDVSASLANSSCDRAIVKRISGLELY
jgi:hypothetical protein